MTSLDRARGAFWGLALGDALGMPTQSMPPEEITADYGRIEWFVAAGPQQRIAAGMPAGSITDDTEQAVLIARMLIGGGVDIDPRRLAAALVEWEQEMAAKGSLDLLGPSTKAAVTKLTRGEPVAEAGRSGTTNGAAMRVAPVGIAVPVNDLARFVDVVTRSSLATHNTSVGIAAAAAVGGAVSAGVSGADIGEAIEFAVAAARLGERRGHWSAGASIAERVPWAASALTSAPPAQRSDVVRRLIGTSLASQESVVAALALAAVSDDPWSTLLMAAGLGGDTDTIGAMAGAVLGAVHGMAAWPEAAIAEVRRVNALDLDPLTVRLLALRNAAGTPAILHDVRSAS